MGKTVNERNQGTSIAEESTASIGIGDIAHLLSGDVKKFGQLFPVRGRLVEHDDRQAVVRQRAADSCGMRTQEIAAILPEL